MIYPNLIQHHMIVSLFISTSFGLDYQSTIAIKRLNNRRLLYAQNVQRVTEQMMKRVILKATWFGATVLVGACLSRHHVGPRARTAAILEDATRRAQSSGAIGFHLGAGRRRFVPHLRVRRRLCQMPTGVRPGRQLHERYLHYHGHSAEWCCLPRIHQGTKWLVIIGAVILSLFGRLSSACLLT